MTTRFNHNDDDDEGALCEKFQAEEMRAFGLKKTASVDFSQLRQRSSLHLRGKEKPSMASQFSLRAARGSFSSGMFLLDETSSLTRMNKLPPQDECAATSGGSEVDPLTSEVLATTTWETSSDIVLNGNECSWLRRLLPKLSVFVLLFGSMTSQLRYRAETSSVPLPRSSSIGLGSAAISSVTDALSPILPFAGGLDLRREDYQFWSTGNWWERLQEVVVQVQDAFTTVEVEIDVELTESDPMAIQRKAKDMSSNSKYVPVLAAQKPFVSLELIGDLTLGEVAETFRYAVESSQSGFSESRFMNSVSPRVKPIIKAVRAAVDRSKQGAKDAIVPPGKKVKKSFGQVDALKFAAAMRLFAEWRLIRQVPEGYKGYAVGMGLGHKDVVQNVAKIEQAVHEWFDFLRGLRSLNASKPSKTDDDIYTPTLHQLLKHELEFDVHPSLPRLKEKSAGMGLLWVRRQLQYQTRLFENVLKVPSKYSSTRDAIGAAYRQVYDAYHGWAVQKIFNYSFQAAPEAEIIFRHMNPHRLAEVIHEAKGSMSSDKNKKTGVTDSDSHPKSNHQNPVLAALDHVGSEWHKLTDHVGGEWDKFARFCGNVFTPNEKKTRSHNKADSSLVEMNEEMESFVTQQMVNDAQKQITAYLTIVNPLLEDLAVLFDALNMNDPTKV